MSRTYKRYPINQCALYRCTTRKRLARLLHIDYDELKTISKDVQYFKFQIKKKDNLTQRTITAPRERLKHLQSRILHLLQPIETPSWLISGQRGKCYIDNGVYHRACDYMLAVDIRSFYDNCKRDAVYRFFVDTLITEPDVAKILTDLVTHDGGIPTGCPTSQIIAYYSYQQMFKEIACVAEEYGCRFSLYVDDMTFSSMQAFSPKQLAREVDIILRRYGHRPKYRKTKYYSREEAKPITGVVLKDWQLLLPNSLQKKIYDSFQNYKKYSDYSVKDPEQSRLINILIGQLQAAHNIVPDSFPEISRQVRRYRRSVVNQ